MKNTYLCMLMSLLTMLITTEMIAQQVLVNKKWEQSFGNPSEIDWSSSVIDAGGNIITTGNTVISPTKIALLLTKQSTSGTILWQKTFTISNESKNYGVALTTDNVNNIYVVGSCYENESTKHNMLIMKYNSSGTKLWHKTYNGPGNHDDAAVAVICNGTGSEVYVTGPSYGSNSLADYLTLKLNSSNGSTLWERRFNHSSNLNDIPIALSFDGSGKVVISGGSATDALNYDVLTLKYNTNGTLNDSIRIANPGLGYDQPSALAKDAAGNLYITGSTTSDGVNFDIQTIKLNGNLDLVWKKTFDLSQGDDRATSVCVDAESNVYTCGYASMEDGQKVFIALKYASNGDLVWSRKYGEGETEALARKGLLDAEGNLIMTGVIKNEVNSSWMTLQLNGAGDILWEKRIESGDSDEAKPTDIKVLANGDLVVSGIKDEAGESVYTTIKYEFLKRSGQIVLVNDQPHHRAGEFIVKFLPQYVNTEFVDDKTIRYGSIYDILKLEAIENIVNIIELREAKFAKVFPRLSTAHTQSTTRLGEVIPMPEFWSVFLVVLEEGQDVEALMADFEALTDYVVYAHPNHVNQHHTIPNDALFGTGDQSSLFPSDDFPDADINVEPAWNIETGQNYTKVGVYDDVIFWAHEDFGDGTLEGSQIEGGWDFNNDTNIAEATDPESHGTAVGGIIGALRDNGTGIAGIAGGGFDANGNFNDGVQLFSLGIFDDEYAGDDVVGPAIVEGAMFDESQSPSGYGLHIQNHSWGGPDSPTKRDAVEFAWRNECILVASRGNGGDETLNFPATYNDDWILSVGGSGTNGERYNGNNGNDWTDLSGFGFAGASFGEDMDIIAPAVTENVMSLINPNFPWEAIVNGVDLYPPPVGATNNYQVFNGTSAAAPHVSGVAALMYSRHHVNQGQPNNLAPEDVEFILQRYATDIVGGELNYPMGEDIENGFGRLNAFESVSRINGPQWQVFHSHAPDNIQQTTAVNQEWTILTGIANLPGGVYFGDRVTITHTYLDVFSPTTQIIDNWIRWSATDGVSAANPVSGALWADFDFVINGFVASVTVTTNTLHITSNANGQNLDIWYPVQPNDIRTAYSLHLFDPQATSVVDMEASGLVTAFPNPTTGALNIEYKLSDAVPFSVRILDITGKVIFEKRTGAEKHNTIVSDISAASAGIYICQLLTDKGVISKKVVKQ